jgi:hypothetical protein
MPLLLPQLDFEDSSSFRNVTEYDLVKAHAFAPRLLASWRTVDRAYWRQQAASLMFGGVMPLLGYALLNWSVTLIIVCTTVELCVALLADWLKIALAGDAVRREVERANEGDFVYAVVRALRRAKSQHIAPGTRPRIGAVRVAKAYDNSEATLASWMRLSAFLLLMLCIVTVCIVWAKYQEDFAKYLFRASLFWAIGVSALVRLASAYWSGIHGRRSERPQPSLMPGVMASAYTLILALPLTGLVLVGLSALEEHFHFKLADYFPRNIAGASYIASYFLISLFFGWLAWRSYAQREPLLREYLAGSMEQHLEKLRRLQGILPSVGGVHAVRTGVVESRLG